MPKDEPEISIIIVSYNTKELTLNCLASVYKETTAVSFEIILIDNASADNSAAAVAEQYSQVQVIALKENVGFAKANNLAAQYARGNYLLLLNPDTVIINNAVQKLFTFAQENQEAGIWGGRTIYSDGLLNPTCCYGKTTPFSLFCKATGLAKILPNSVLFNPECFGSWHYDSVREVDIITGCFMLIKTSLWKQLGGFDPLFFMFGEEVDLCFRAKRLGYSPTFTPEAEIIHYGGASEADKGNRWTKVFRAKATIIHKHWPQKYIGFGIRMLRFWAASRSAALTMLAMFAPEKFSSQKQIWSNVWQKRSEWERGFN